MYHRVCREKKLLTHHQPKIMTIVNKKEEPKHTPLMEQFWAIKKQHPDSLLLYRMGDFFEMFGEDAKIGARLLGITLTSRNHGKGCEEMPLAGFPYRQLETYLAKLIRAGQRVAVCEQVEDPKLAKGLVKREVIEIATPGTALNPSLLEDKRNLYLAGVCVHKKMAGFAYIDLSTGEFWVTEVPLERLRSEIERIMPAELIVPPNWYGAVDHLEFKADFPGITFTEREEWIFELETALDELRRHFKVISLEGFGCGDLTVGVSAAGAVLHYVQEMQKNALNHIVRLSRYFSTDYMALDPQTRRNLELIAPLKEGESSEGTLLRVIDRSQTPMGGRLLRQWLLRPLLQADRINLRLSAVEEIVQSGYLRTEVQENLKNLYDLERLIARVAVGKANARDLLALRLSLERLPDMLRVIAPLNSPLLAQIKQNLNSGFPQSAPNLQSEAPQSITELVDMLNRALRDDPPLPITEGGLIKKGFHAELDDLRAIAFDAKSYIANMQNKERDRTGINSLKINYNKVFGYYIEISNANKDAAPSDYIRKQTLSNAERYITPELKEFEDKVLGAEEKIVKLEYDLFMNLRDRVAEHIETIQDMARALAELDVLCGLATLALENNYVKPRVSAGGHLRIIDGRHPVVESLLPTGTFVPNDCELNTTDVPGASETSTIAKTVVPGIGDMAFAQIMLITGPNMAGKSTYLRQTGLIVLLAQIGSFVPAKSADIGVVDRIFTRVGAQDNLARGESTFLVEMNETAYILNNATSRSLILLDEIGRGTSTFDGLSIAWAVVEYLHENGRMQPKTLFATHYHELTDLAQILPRIKNYNVVVKEWEDDIVFLRKIIPGGSDRSYGIQVARLAGLPKEVVVRAKEVLANLEASELTPGSNEPRLAQGAHAPRKTRKTPLNQMSLFGQPAPEKIIVEVEKPHPVVEKLKALDPNSLTPLQALELVFELAKNAKQR